MNDEHEFLDKLYTLVQQENIAHANGDLDKDCWDEIVALTRERATPQPAPHEHYYFGHTCISCGRILTLSKYERMIMAAPEREEWEKELWKMATDTPEVVMYGKMLRIVAFVAALLADEKQKTLQLITNEIATAHTEGTPTARLTSLYNRLTLLKE